MHSVRTAIVPNVPSKFEFVRALDFIPNPEGESALQLLINYKVLLSPFHVEQNGIDWTAAGL